MPKASIIVPVFNRPSQILDCLNSLLSQSEKDFEVIIVNDGSSIETGESIERFIKRNHAKNFHTTTNQTNLGITKAKNIGIEKASGDFIVFTDSDCKADKDWLKNILKALENYDAVSGLVLDPEPRNIPERAFFGTSKIYQHPLQGRLIVEHNCGFKKEIIKNYRFDEIIDYGGEGAELAWRLKKDGHSFGFAENAIVYHDHPLDFKELLKIARKTGRGEAKLHFKKKTFLGRDVICTVLGIICLCLGLLLPQLLLTGLVLLVCQLGLLIANEILFKSKSFIESIIVLPANIVYNLEKARSMSLTILKILLGQEKVRTQ